MNYKKVRFQNLNEIVYQMIKEQIIQNEIEPGERLTVEDMAEKLGVSRTPVSNAFKSLEQDGYLVIYPRSGTYVRELTSEEIATLYDFREVIEGLAMRKIVDKVDGKKLQQYLNLFQMFVERDGFSTDESAVRRFCDMEMEFHEYLISCCPNIISSEIRNLIDLTKRSRLLNIEHKFQDDAEAVIRKKDIQRHIDLIEALLAHDLDKSEACIREDIRASKCETLLRMTRAEGK